MTKIIILAAGQGTRLRPLTEKLPKTLVALQQRSILQEQMIVYRQLNLDNIIVVGGHCIKAFDQNGYKLIENKAYKDSNMVHSFFCASSEFDGEDDIIVVYGDIVFQPEVLAALLKSKGDVVVTADLDWQSLWQLRMDDPLSDAETFQYDPDTKKLISLGKKTTNLQDIQAQYIGLVKFSKEIVKELSIFFSGQTKNMSDTQYKNMYFTDFLQLLIDSTSYQVTSHLINRCWLEVDSVEDLKIYQQYLNKKDYQKLGFEPTS